MPSVPPHTHTFEIETAEIADITAGTSDLVVTSDVIKPFLDNKIDLDGGNVADLAALRAALGLEIGADVQAYDADLSAIGALAKTDGNVIFGNGSAWVALNGSTARAALGLTIGSDVQAYSSLLTTQASVEFDFTVNSRTAAASVNLSGFSRVLVNRWDNSSKIAPAKYEKVAQPGNVEPAHDFKFQDSGGLWFEIVKSQIITPFMRGAVGDGAEDDAAALNSFFDFVVNYDTDNETMPLVNGEFGAGSGLTIGHASTLIWWKEFVGTMRIIALDVIDTVITFRNLPWIQWSGQVNVIGLGDESYTSRTCTHAVVFEGVCGRSQFSGFYTRYFQGYGVYVNGLAPRNHNGINLGIVTAHDCGSATSELSGQLTATVSGRTDTGSASSTGQRTVLDVDVLPPEWVDTDLSRASCAAKFADQCFTITAIDRVNNTVELNCWPEIAETTGAIEYIFGGVRVQGGDANCGFITRADVTRCGIGFHGASLYGWTLGGIFSHYNGITMALGGATSSASRGWVVEGFYSETSNFDIIKMTTADYPNFDVKIEGHRSLTLTKCASIHKYRSLADAVLATYDNFKDIDGLAPSGLGGYEKLSANASGTASQITFAPNRRDYQVHVRRPGTSALTVALDQVTGINALYGYDSGTLTVSGVGTWGNPTTTSITFDPPVGGTVNGGATDATLAFAGFYGAASFDIFKDGLNWYVRLTSGREAPETVTTTASNADFSLTPWLNAPNLIHSGTLTAARTITLVTTNAVAAKTFWRITRTGSGLFQLIIGSLGALGQGEWMDVGYDGSAYYVRDRGRVSQPATTVSSDADFTYTAHAYGTQVTHTGTLTADRAVTLVTTNAIAGDEVYFRRTGGGAFDLNIGTGPLLSLATNEQGVLRFDGSAWIRKSGPEAV